MDVCSSPRKWVTARARACVLACARGFALHFVPENGLISLILQDAKVSRDLTRESLVENLMERFFIRELVIGDRLLTLD